MWEKGVFMTALTTIYKLISDETRLRMMLLLYQENLCVCQLAGILNVPQPRISKYLSKLRDLDLVYDQRKSKFVYYTLKKEHPMLTLNFNKILENIANYPKIQQDQLSLPNKQIYIIK